MIKFLSVINCILLHWRKKLSCCFSPTLKMIQNHNLFFQVTNINLLFSPLTLEILLQVLNWRYKKDGQWKPCCEPTFIIYRSKSIQYLILVMEKLIKAKRKICYGNELKIFWILLTTLCRLPTLGIKNLKNSPTTSKKLTGKYLYEKVFLWYDSAWVFIETKNLLFKVPTFMQVKI